MAEQGNQHALKHGGGAAELALTSGAPLTGPAQERQALVIAEVEENGVDSVIERNAQRLQAVADIYYDQLLQAAEQKNADKVDAYAARYGWLASKAVLVWKDVKAAHKQRKPALDGVLKDYANEPSR